jgi:type II secretory pathway pseudopilin PulG
MNLRYCRHLQNSRGITLVEMTVALGIMALVSAGVATGIYGLMSGQSSLSHRMDGSEFIGSLARSLNDKNSCKNYLEKREVENGDVYRSVSIPNYDGFGGRPPETLASGYVINGTTQNPQLRVDELSWRKKPNTAAETMTINGKSLSKTVMQMRVGLQVLQQGKLVDLADREIEFVALINNSDQLVESCEGSPSPEDTCTLVGASYNHETGACDAPDEGCIMRGSYTRSFCGDEGTDPNARSANPCRATKTAPSRRNEETNAYRCPVKSDLEDDELKMETLTTFNYTWVSKEQIGKKSFRNVKNTIRSYVCLECKSKANAE